MHHASHTRVQIHCPNGSAQKNYNLSVGSKPFDAEGDKIECLLSIVCTKLENSSTADHYASTLPAILRIQQNVFTTDTAKTNLVLAA